MSTRKQYAIYKKRADGQYVYMNALKVFATMSAALGYAEIQNGKLGEEVYVVSSFE
jgi:hypothetical protein